VHLIAENLTVARGSRTVIDGLSFRVGSGEALCITGPNGSGKTTLIRTLAGFIVPVAGAVRLEGGDLERTPAEQCHYVGHLNGIKASLTGGETLAFWAGYLGGRETRAGSGCRVIEALQRFGLDRLAHIPAGFLSAGQRRRLGLARLLVVERPIWLLDEPTVSLDAVATAFLAELVTAHVADGGIVVAATHLPLGIEGAKYLRLDAAAEAA
jgi:heme exporter protein A